MRRILWPAAVLLLLPALVHADWVIKQKVEGNLQQGEMTIRIKEDRTRVDVADQMSMLIHSATGDSVTIMHPQKSFFRVPGSESQALMEQMRKLQQAGGGEAELKLQPTGKKEKVSDRDCEIYTLQTGQVKVTYWVAPEFPNAASLLAALEKMQSGGLAAVARGLTPKATDFPGLPMKTEITFGNQKVTTTIVSVEEQNVDPGIFNVPGDYKELPAPKINFPQSESK